MTKSEKRARRVDKIFLVRQAITKGRKNAASYGFVKDFDIAMHIIVEIERAGFKIIRSSK